jgi:hypothetical protein
VSQVCQEVYPLCKIINNSWCWNEDFKAVLISVSENM